MSVVVPQYDSREVQSLLGQRVPHSFSRSTCEAYTNKFTFKAHWPLDEPDAIFDSDTQYLLSIFNVSSYSSREVSETEASFRQTEYNIRSLETLSSYQHQTYSRIPIGEFRDLDYPFNWTKVTLIVHEFFDPDTRDVSDRALRTFNTEEITNKYVYFSDGSLLVSDQVITNSDD